MPSGSPLDTSYSVPVYGCAAAVVGTRVTIMTRDRRKLKKRVRFFFTTDHPFLFDIPLETMSLSVTLHDAKDQGFYSSMSALYMV